MMSWVTLLLLTNNKTISLYYVRPDLTSLYILASSKLTAAWEQDFQERELKHTEAAQVLGLQTTGRLPCDTPDTPASAAGQAASKAARQSWLFYFKMKCSVRKKLRLNLDIRSTMAFLLMLLNIFFHLQFWKKSELLNLKETIKFSLKH